VDEGRGHHGDWNSVRSRFRVPSNLRKAIMGDAICLITWLRLMKIGLSISRLLQKMPQMTSEGTILVLKGGQDGEYEVVGLSNR
jgi:hypothetical protein